MNRSTRVRSKVGFLGRGHVNVVSITRTGRQVYYNT